MQEADVIEVLRQAFWTTLVICSPPLLAGSLIGLIIALFQALTQIQEITLTFVPKFAVIFVVIVLTLPLTFHALGQYTAFVGDKIVNGY
ncbi:MAG: flagellar biosynthetic protein FliQ [Oricola sp.]|jgi:flagellar biosynthesis protein FliQ|nr:flagellar biosynthetic protein FliQ [Oricola sp.]